MSYKGPLKPEQLAAIHAKNRRDVAGMQKMERNLRVGEGSLPQYEETYARRGLSLIKRATGQRDAIHDAQVEQREATENERKKKLSELDQRIEQERELRSELASKKINFDEYVEKLEKINPRSAQSERARAVLPDLQNKVSKEEIKEMSNTIGLQYIKDKTELSERLASGKIDKNEYDQELSKIESSNKESMRNIGLLEKSGDPELANMLKSKEFREKYFQDIRQPMKIFPGGSQQGNLTFNPESKKYEVTHRLSVEQQRRLGVDNPVMEGPLKGGEGELIVMTAPERPPPDMKSEKPTFQSVKQEKEERNRKPERPSSSGNIADTIFSTLEMA